MTAALLIHGYLGGPFEMEPLAAPLEDLGLSVRLVTLPGHASSVDELRRSTFKDWRVHIEQEYDRLLAEHDEVIVLGFSLGGALGLHLAETRSPKALITMAAPVFPPDLWYRQIRDWLGVFLPGKKLLRPYRAEAQGIAPWQGYKNVAHPPHFYDMCKGFAAVRRNLGKITAPIMIFHDFRDRVIHSDNASAISWGVSSRRVELEVTHIKEPFTVCHIITTHQETQHYIINRTRAFVAEICGLPRPALWARTRKLNKI